MDDKTSPYLRIQKEEIAEISQSSQCPTNFSLIGPRKLSEVCGSMTQTLSKRLKQVTYVIINHLSHIIQFPTTEEA